MLKCEQCGAEFTPSQPRHKFCSVKCRNAARYRRIARVELHKTCPHCGKEFTTLYPQRVYCSKQCNDRACYERNYKKHERAKKICLICGEEYTPNSNQQKYCSRKCAAVAQLKNVQKWREKNSQKVSERNRKYNREYRARRGKRYVRKPRNEIACKLCGKLFLQNFPTQKFCSPKCCSAFHHGQERSKIAVIREWVNNGKEATPDEVDNILAMIFKN